LNHCRQVFGPPASTMASAAALGADAVPDGTKDYVPLRSHKYDVDKRPHISEMPMTWKNWYKHVNWLNTTLIVFIPMIGLVATYWIPLHVYTAIFAILYYFNAGLGITAGELLSCDSADRRNADRLAR
jgi:stearoyl-CoA desaturase (Delta-9 desaturase)